MPTYQGLELAQERHHFRTIINLFPEHTPERSPLWPDEVRFAHEHGLNYVGNEPGDDPSGESFIAQTLTLAQDPSTWPILVHCHASMDRSPAWMGLYRFVVQGWPLADALREIEYRHRGLRPSFCHAPLQSRPPPARPGCSTLDPTVPFLRETPAGTADPVAGVIASPASKNRQDSQARRLCPMSADEARPVEETTLSILPLQVDQGPGQRTPTSQGGVSLVLGRRYLQGRSGERPALHERREAGGPGGTEAQGIDQGLSRGGAISWH